MVKRKVFLYFQESPESELNDVEFLTLYESLLVKLSNEASGIIIFESSDVTNTPETYGEKTSLAAESGSDAWLLVTVGGHWKAISIRAESFDIVRNDQVIDITMEKSGSRGLDRLFWNGLLEAVNNNYQRLPQRISDQSLRVTEVTLNAQPGTEIVGLAEESLMADAEGKVSVLLFTKASYQVRAILDGYYPVNRSFYVDDSPLEIHLNQVHTSRLGWDFYMSNLAYPGIEYSLYIIPSYFYLRFGFTTFAIGMPVWGGTERESIPLTHLNLSIGFYLGDPDYVIRLYFSTGMFLRVLNVQNEDRNFSGFDPASSMGLFPVLGTDFSGLPHIRLFLEYRPLFYLTTSGAESLISSNTVSNSAASLFGGGLVLEYLRFNLGLRLLL